MPLLPSELNLLIVKLSGHSTVQVFREDLRRLVFATSATGCWQGLHGAMKGGDATAVWLWGVLRSNRASSDVYVGSHGFLQSPCKLCCREMVPTHGF